MLIQKDRFWKEGDGNYERHLYIKYSNKEKKWKGSRRMEKACKRAIEIEKTE
jgi:hypothetical protein